MLSKEIIQSLQSYDHVMTSEEDLSEHMGKWLIIYDNKIFASDEDLDGIYNKFKEEHPGKIPFVIKMIKEQEMLF